MTSHLRYRRPFEVWTYRPTHCLLLLRNKGDGRATRVEVLFRGVSFMQLPTVLDELEVAAAPPDRVGLRPEDVDDRCGFVIAEHAMTHRRGVHSSSARGREGVPRRE